MPDEVKPARRRYHSPLRERQAASTRGQILDAAGRLFERQGFAATTMAAVAAEAGVAVKTVYLAFETKSGLLRALWNQRLRGGDEQVPVAQQRWYREVLEEPDPERRLRLNARNARRAKVRVGALFAVIHAAAQTDPDIGALWTRIQEDFHENQGRIVASLGDEGALRPGLSVERATDIVWTLNHPAVWTLLVGERGWTPDEFEQWLGDSFCAQLLGS